LTFQSLFSLFVYWRYFLAKVRNGLYNLYEYRAFK